MIKTDVSRNRLEHLHARDWNAGMKTSFTAGIGRTYKGFLGLSMIVGALSACDSTAGPEALEPEANALLGTGADQARVNDLSLQVSMDNQDKDAPKVELVQIGFVDKPKELQASAGATSTSFYAGKNEGLFATVYNTAGGTVGGAISTIRVKKGKIKVDKDIMTSKMEFAEARLIESGKYLFLLAAGTGVMDGSLDIKSEAIFIATDLSKVANVFDLPSGWAMGFDFAPLDHSLVVVATAPTGSLSYLDPMDPSGSVKTIVNDEPAFLGLASQGSNTYVTDVSGSVRAFDPDGGPAGTWSLGGALNIEERAEVSVCPKAMVVGAHTNGVLVHESGIQVAAGEFGIGASILDDCSAFAATMEGGIVVGIRGIAGYYTYKLKAVNERPLPYANSVEILSIPEGSPILGSKWEAEDGGMLLLVVSSANGTHFIEIRMEED